MRLLVIIIYFISMLFVVLFVFFFSSRRRHTRCSRDWSSDVCSSDLRELRVKLGQVAARSWAGTASKVDGAGKIDKADLVEEARSEEHTSELQSRLHLVCRLLLEKKNRERAPIVWDGRVSHGSVW